MANDRSNFEEQDGFDMRRSVLALPELLSLASRVDGCYQTLEEARRRGGLAAVNPLVPSGQRFVATASSLTLGAVLSDEELQCLLTTISTGPAGAWIRNESKDQIACDLDQAWVRRQYAPEHYPPLHAPHGWHQDGALGFDFLSYGDGSFPADALLSMVTCWITLVPCGAESPGLELVTQRLESLLAPADLTEERVRARFAPEEFWRPVLEAGDALLFRGDILHRTQVTPAMSNDRTSLELRFFPAHNLPLRLQSDRFVPLN
jgi:hypothetical protein